MNKKEEASCIYSTVTWLVNDKESRNRQYKWRQREIDHIRLGISLMNERQQVAFRERFKSYQIIKALDGDVTAIEFGPIGMQKKTIGEREP